MGTRFIAPLAGVTDWGRLALVLICFLAYACFTPFHLDKAGARNVAVLIRDAEEYMPASAVSILLWS